MSIATTITVAIVTSLYLMLPLVISGIIHMVVVRSNVFKVIKIPIHQQAFGENKTWRGVLVMPVLSMLGVWATQQIPVEGSELVTVSLVNESAIILGILLGLGYVIFELPNSFIKRRLGIAPGKLPPSKKIIFIIIDQADSAIGCALVYLLMKDISVMIFLIIIFLGPLIHLLVNLTLYLLGLRKEPV